MWLDPNNKNTFDAIINVIKEINADIIVLQEAGELEQIQLGKLEELQYVYDQKNLYFKGFEDKGKYYGNMILIKKSIKYTAIPQKVFDIDKDDLREKRGFIAIKVELERGKSFNIYGTHLDVWDNTEETRTKEIEELIKITNDTKEACIIAADCNAVRKFDYQYNISERLVWDLLNGATKSRIGANTPTKALALLQENGFIDCFTKNSQQPPKFTVWTGTTVDFLWLNKEWRMPIDGAYVYYSHASDHLPIIMDIKID